MTGEHVEHKVFEEAYRARTFKTESEAMLYKQLKGGEVYHDRKNNEWVWLSRPAPVKGISFSQPYMTEAK
jgi:hypothetical protein